MTQENISKIDYKQVVVRILVNSSKNFGFIMLASLAILIALILFSFGLELLGSKNPHFEQIITVNLFGFVAAHLEKAALVLIIAVTFPTIAQE